MTDLSIIVVTWNTRDLTLGCLAQLEGEGLYPGSRGSPSSDRELDCQLLVVDNGSRDGSAEAIRLRFPDAEVIALPTNCGFARGSNAALAKAVGRVVLLLNSDAWMTRSAARRCLEVLDARADVGIVGPQLVHPDGRLQNSVHAFPGAATELVPAALREWLWPARYPSKRYAHITPVEVDAVLGAALFVRREALDAVGPLPEEYFFFLEETAWCWRMRAAGWRILQIPDARVVHVSGASAKAQHAALARIEFHRSLYHFLGAHRGAPTRRLAISLRVARLLLSLALLWPLALVSPHQRRRLGERRCLLAWHLRGRPAEVGLASIE